VDSKKKCRQYPVEYLKFDFIASPQNVQFPHCILCDKTFTSNEAKKPLRVKDHLSRVHCDNASKEHSYFKHLTAKSDKRSTVS
jgi:hypothetical protein